MNAFVVSKWEQGVQNNPKPFGTIGLLRSCQFLGMFVVACIAPSSLLAEHSQVLIPMDATWRYDSTGTQSNEVWKMFGYDDSSWPSGQALLGYEKSEVYLEPIRTELNLEMPGSTNYVLKYYFRTS